MGAGAVVHYGGVFTPTSLTTAPVQGLRFPTLKRICFVPGVDCLFLGIELQALLAVAFDEEFGQRMTLSHLEISHCHQVFRGLFTLHTGIESFCPQCCTAPAQQIFYISEAVAGKRESGNLKVAH